ncbi:MAG: hypothetical protein HY319_06325 [Armatimonadetes bacterium]|nr:hypothetical protein [Armatimonadota bacterium]
MAIKKSPVTREEFSQTALPVKVVIDGQEVTADVKEFSTGSFGWYLNSKVNVKIGDKSVPVQVGMNLIIIGSKDAE